jgi:hypothetical protein
MVAAAFSCGKGDFMSKEPFEAMPDVMDAKQLAEALPPIAFVFSPLLYMA